MSATMKSDFSSLAMQTMPNLDGGATMTTSFGTTAPWNQPSLNSMAGASSTATATTPGGNSQPPLLQKTNASSVGSLSFKVVNVDDLLEQRQREIMENLVNREMEATRRMVEKAHEDRLVQDWEEEKETFLKELAGERVLGGSSQQQRRLRNVASAQPIMGSSSTSASTGTGGNAFSSSFGSSVSPSKTMVPRTNLKEITQAHVQLVARWNRVPPNTATDGSANIAEAFARIAGGEHPSYAMAWKLLAVTTTDDSYNTASPPDSATKGTATMTTTLPVPSPLVVAIDTLSHLARQFQALVRNRVQKASLAGLDVRPPQTYPNGMANTVATFVKLQHGSQASVWNIIYYCLRCGDAAAARSIVGGSDTAEPVCKVLNVLSAMQSTAPCLWDRRTTLGQVNRDSMLELRSQQNSVAVEAVGVGAADHYEQACLNLLTADESDKTWESSSVVTTIEDYLYAKLWVAVQTDRPEDQLEALGASIRGYGSHYFESETTGGWSYALPLLLSQQYRSALLHLTEVGGPLGLLQAAHLALALGGQHPIQDLGNVMSSSQLLTNLIVELSKQLQPADPLAAIEYLVRIPNESRRKTEIARVIAESRRFELIAGKLSADGVRQGTGDTLDKHFTRTQISSILEEAAQITMTRKGNIPDALELLNLAERYDELLEVLNKKLLSLIDKLPSRERSFWRQTAESFHAWHLSRNRTHVMEVLESQHKTNLVMTSKVILKLFAFFDHLTMQQFQEASALIMDDMGLLPNSMEDIQAKVTNFLSLDSQLQDAFAPILFGSMNSLYQQHQILTHSGRMMTMIDNRNSKDTVQQRRNELREKAKALTTFSGRLNLNNASGTGSNSSQDDLLLRMTRMEASMI